jgi:hypothetical protein
MAVTLNNLDVTSSGALRLTATGANAANIRTNGVDRITVNESGDVGLGVSPFAHLSMYRASGTGLAITNSTMGIGVGQGFQMSVGAGADAYLWNAANGPVLFGTNNTERMRIDAAGNLLMRTSVAPTNAFNSQSFVNLQCGIQLTHTSNGNTYRQMTWSGDPADAALYFPGGTSLGSVTNTAILSPAGAWTNASDGRQKTNITTIKYGLNTVLECLPRSYTRIDTKGEFIGFVAQELKQSIPEVVIGSDETSYGVDYGSLVAVAFKAIQELSAKVDTLQAELNTLKGN